VRSGSVGLDPECLKQILQLATEWLAVVSGEKNSALRRRALDLLKLRATFLEGRSIL
jgi:hypothetical protein